MTRKDAIKILQDFGFYTKFYYILKVYNSCNSMTRESAKIQQITFDWGYNVLKDTLNLIKSKYKDSLMIEIIANQYIRYLNNEFVKSIY